MPKKIIIEKINYLIKTRLIQILMKGRLNLNTKKFIYIKYNFCKNLVFSNS